MDNLVSPVNDHIYLCAWQAIVTFESPGTVPGIDAADAQRRFDLLDVHQTDILKGVAALCEVGALPGQLFPDPASYSRIGLYKFQVEQRV